MQNYLSLLSAVTVTALSKSNAGIQQSISLLIAVEFYLFNIHSNTTSDLTILSTPYWSLDCYFPQGVIHLKPAMNCFEDLLEHWTSSWWEKRSRGTMHLPTTNALGGARHYFGTLGPKRMTNLASYLATSLSPATCKTVCTLSPVLATVWLLQCTLQPARRELPQFDEARQVSPQPSFISQPSFLE